jgi:NAD(P)-dependent dehydrogenase (short-subunit alcohol dehydrogenase family)
MSSTASATFGKTLKGKTVVVTGATSGIGLATAEQLASDGASIVLLGRDAARAETAAQRVSRASDGQRPQIVLADFASLADVRRAAAEIQRRVDRIDVLVNNAGAIFARREETTDGIEKTFAVNHIAPFLLTNLLIGTLLEADRPRVVTVTSETYAKRLDFDNLEGERHYNFFRAYQQSKLANILFSNELARILSNTGLTANAVSPGPTRTRFGDEMTGLPSLMPKIVKRLPVLFRPPEEAARGIVQLAAAPELADVTGRFFLKLKETKLKPGASDVAAARQLWTVSAALTELGDLQQEIQLADRVSA